MCQMQLVKVEIMNLVFFKKQKTDLKLVDTDALMNRVGRGVLTDFGSIKSAVGLRDVPGRTNRNIS
jgi:hypothetical protein